MQSVEEVLIQLEVNNLAFHLGQDTKSVSPFMPMTRLTATTTHPAMQRNTPTAGTFLNHSFLQLGTKTGNK